MSRTVLVLGWRCSPLTPLAQPVCSLLLPERSRVISAEALRADWRHGAAPVTSQGPVSPTRCCPVRVIAVSLFAVDFASFVFQNLIC